MDKEIKAEWVRRLRSGDYTQAREILIAADIGEKEQLVVSGHCCLGVLVDYAIEAGCPSIRYQDGSNGSKVEVHRPEVDARIEGDGWMEFFDNDLPQEVVDWSGLTDPNPTLPGGSTLIGLNDDQKYTFEQIARVVDEEL